MNIFIVDDHFMIIEGIRSLLINEPLVNIIGHASSASSCMAFLKKQLPDIILMDINLPDKSGIDLCKEVKQNYPSVLILGLSTFNQESFISKMIENGASGYILKNAGKKELIEALETVNSGKTFLSNEATKILRKAEKSKLPVLTRREKEVITLIAEGLTNAEIANKLFISASTVDTHRTNLLEKFEVKNTAALIKIAVERHLI